MLRAIVAFLIGAAVAAVATYVAIERKPATASAGFVPPPTMADPAPAAMAPPSAEATSAAAGDSGRDRIQLVADFRARAARDAEGALAAAGALESLADRRLVAAGLMTVLGRDEATIARIVAAVPGTDATSLRVEALLEHAARDPSGALQAALATADGTARRIALPEIGAVWGLDEPSAALSAAAMIGEPEEAAAFRNGVLRQWARTDIEAFLAYFEQRYPLSGPAETASPLIDALALAAAIDADRVLAIADRFDAVRARVVRGQALQVMLASNPDEAFARLAAMPADVREGLLPTVALAYGRLDPDAALAWARSLDPSSPQVLQAVMSGIQAVAPERAIDAAVAAAGRGVARTASLGLLPVLGGSSEVASRLLNSLGDSPESRTTRLLTLSSMVRSDPEAALDWIKTNPLSSAELSLQLPRLVEAFAARDAEAALRMTDTLPEGMRTAWRAEVEAYMARSDPSMLGRLFANASVATGSAAERNELIQPALRAARANPAAAFGQIDNASEELRSLIVATTMPDWVAKSPTEASRWAADVDDAELRAGAVRQVALAWGQQDLAAARRWVVDLPKDAARDRALTGLMLAAAREQGIDESLLPEFGSEKARQEAIVGAARSMALNDPAQARAVLDRYVTDPEIRRAGELEIERARTTIPGVLRPTPLPGPSR